MVTEKSKGKKLAEHLIHEWNTFAPPGSKFVSWVIDYLKSVDDKTLEDVMNKK